MLFVAWLRSHTAALPGGAQCFCLCVLRLVCGIGLVLRSDTFAFGWFCDNRLCGCWLFLCWRSTSNRPVLRSGVLEIFWHVEVDLSGIRVDRRHDLRRLADGVLRRDGVKVGSVQHLFAFEILEVDNASFAFF